jgi:adenine-specific DNA-methyltransferase
MSSNQKLELSWLGKGDDLNLEPRLLLLQPEHCVGNAEADNMLIHGDNLLALKALEQHYAGKVKCIYIDPPYNTGNAFEHYDDMQEHSLWLNLMYHRLVLLKNLLHTEGSIWVTLDDNEVHYCKVMMDEIFGRQNFVGTVIWEKTDSPRMDAVYFSIRHDTILVYAKDKSSLKLNKIETTDIPQHYDKVDSNNRQYYLKPLRAMGGADSRKDRPTLYFPITAPDGSEIYPKRQDGSDGRWRWGKEKIENEKERLEWIKTKNGWSISYKIFADSMVEKPAETIWTHSEVGSTRTSKAEIKSIFLEYESVH